MAQKLTKYRKQRAPTYNNGYYNHLLIGWTVNDAS